MGSVKSKPITVNVLGLSHSGKTHFLDMLVFQGDTTKSDTIGTYSALYEHDGQLVEFTEFGGSDFVRPHWIELLERHASADAIYLFIDAQTAVSEQTLLQLYGYFMYALSVRKQKCPICLVYNERRGGPRVTDALAARITALFQFEKLYNDYHWPVSCVTLQYSDMRKWGSVVEVMLDWTIENAKHRE